MRKLSPLAYLRIPILFFAFLGLLEYLIDAGEEFAFVKFPMVGMFLLVFLFLLITIEFTLKAVSNLNYTLLTEEQRKQADADENLSLFQQLNKIFVKPDVVEEKDLLLHHDYDGIQELDNNLPPWWVYLFYACIFFSVVYIAHFEFMGGDTQEQEFEKEMAQAKIEVEAYQKTAPDNTTEENVTLLTSPADLAKGKEIYDTNCVACHRADGGGQIGPNLTDENWILGGGIKNVFHTVANGGRDGKGMIAWKSSGLKPKQIQLVSSYVLSLKGSNPPNPKAPEGDVWVEDAAK